MEINKKYIKIVRKAICNRKRKYYLTFSKSLVEVVDQLKSIFYDDFSNLMEIHFYIFLKQKTLFTSLREKILIL